MVSKSSNDSLFHSHQCANANAACLEECQSTVCITKLYTHLVQLIGNTVMSIVFFYT